MSGDYNPTPVLAKFSLFPSISPKAIIQPWDPDHPYGTITLSGSSVQGNPYVYLASKNIIVFAPIPFTAIKSFNFPASFG